MVAVQESMLPSSGKAEIPGVGVSIIAINSDWSLTIIRILERVKTPLALPVGGASTHRFVTLCESAFFEPQLSLLFSCIVGSPGAEFCVSSLE